MNNGQAFEICFEHITAAVRIRVPRRVAKHILIGQSTSHIDKRVQDHQEVIIVSAIYHFCRGFGQQASSRCTLGEIADLDPVAYQFFIRRAIILVMTLFNVGNRLQLAPLMNMDLTMRENWVNSRIAKGGLWSLPYVIARVDRTPPYNDPLTNREQHMCRGMNWELVRLHSQIHPNIIGPTSLDKWHTMPEQRNILRDPYQPPNLIPRYQAPNAFLGTSKKGHVNRSKEQSNVNPSKEQSKNECSV